MEQSRAVNVELLLVRNLAFATPRLYARSHAMLVKSQEERVESVGEGQGWQWWLPHASS
jgi:hypothetical protein